MIGGFLGVDFTVPLFFPGHGPDMLGALLLGCCIGQVNLIAVWAALAPGNFVVRLPWSALLGTMMWYSLILGNQMQQSSFSQHRLPSPPFSLDDAILLGALLVVGIVIAQIPLWIAGKIYGWKMTSPDLPASRPTHGRLQFSLQQMLLGTTLWSIALAPIRTILPLDVRSVAHFNAEMLMAFAAIALGNSLLTMPYIWGAMHFASKLTASIVGWLVYCVVLAAVEFGIFVALIGRSRNENAVVHFLFCVNASQCVTVFGAMLPLRALGFQLRRTSPAGLQGSPAGMPVVSPPTDVESTLASQATQESP